LRGALDARSFKTMAAYDKRMTSLAFRPSRVNARQLYLLCNGFFLFFTLLRLQTLSRICIITRKITARQVRSFFSLIREKSEERIVITASNINFSLKALTERCAVAVAR